MSCYCDRTPDKRSLRKERFIWAHNSRTESTYLPWSLKWLLSKSANKGQKNKHFKAFSFQCFFSIQNKNLRTSGTPMKQWFYNNVVIILMRGVVSLSEVGVTSQWVLQWVPRFNKPCIKWWKQWKGPVSGNIITRFSWFLQKVELKSKGFS